MSNYTYRKVRCSCGGKKFVTHYVILENGAYIDSFLKLSNARKIYGSIPSSSEERKLLYHSAKG